MMLGKFFFIALVFFAQYCTAVIPDCTGTTDTTKCPSPEYSGACSEQKCVCAAGFVKANDECVLVKPVIKGLPSDNKGKDYDLSFSSEVVEGSNPAFSWTINGTASSATQIHAIKAAKELNNGDYVCKVTVGTKSESSDKVTLAFKSKAVNAISSAILVVFSAVLSRIFNTD